MSSSLSLLIMMLIYISVITLFLLTLRRFAKGLTLSPQHSELVKWSMSRSLSKVLFIVKSIKPLLKNPLTLAIISAILIASSLSAMAASGREGYVLIKVSHQINGSQALVITFNKPVKQLMANNLLSRHLTLNTSCLIHVISYLSIYVLHEPLKLKYNKSIHNIFVLIGVSENVLKDLTNGNGGLITDLLSPQIPAGRVTNITLTALSGKPINLRALGISPRRLKNYLIIDDIHLLPTQMFVGRRPILVPPTFVLVGSLTAINRLGGMPSSYVTEVVALVNNSCVSVKTLSSILHFNPLVKSITLINGSREYLISRGRVPSTQAILASITSSVIASVICLSIFASLAPQASKLYSRLSLIGAPYWVSNVVNALYASVTILIPGITLSAVISLTVGSVQSFSSLVTTLITWFLSITYLRLKVRVKSLRSDIYVKPASRLTLVIPRIKVNDATPIITKALKTNEFFEFEGSELIVRNPYEGVLRVRLRYLNSWGVWVDVEAEVLPNKDSSYLSIQCFVRSVEEVSERVTDEVISLIMSKIYGVVKSLWG